MDDTPDRSHEGISETSVACYTSTKRHTVLALVVYSAIFGIAISILPETPSRWDTVVGLPFLILGIVWCLADARERCHRVGLLMKFLLFLAFCVGFPVYVFQSRGVRGFKTLALAALLTAGLLACALATQIVTQYVSEAFGFPVPAE